MGSNPTPGTIGIFNDFGRPWFVLIPKSWSHVGQFGYFDDHFVAIRPLRYQTLWMCEEVTPPLCRDAEGPGQSPALRDSADCHVERRDRLGLPDDGVPTVGK